jgi:hypothetical protein
MDTYAALKMASTEAAPSTNGRDARRLAKKAVSFFGNKGAMIDRARY